MQKSDVIEHFGSNQAVADALGITKGAVSQWGELVPELRARLLFEITKGELAFNESKYRDTA